MSKNILKSAKTYAKNLAKHAGRVAKRQEHVKDAIAGAAADGKRLRHTIERANRPARRKQAARLTEEGRQNYNNRDYTGAEETFRDAARTDPMYALAYTYLGHSLYQQGRMSEAIAAWRKAIEAEPGSRAANKAEKKIHHVEHSKESIVEMLQERLKK